MTITGIITADHYRRDHWCARPLSCREAKYPDWLTILVGIVAAFVGTFIARLLGVPTATSGIDWLELLVQLIVAVIGVAIVAGAYGRRGIRS